jgi:hypothetical protein
MMGNTSKALYIKRIETAKKRREKAVEAKKLYRSKYYRKRVTGKSHVLKESVNWKEKHEHAVDNRL